MGTMGVAVALIGVAPAQAAPQPLKVHPNMCPADPYLRVQETGVDYESIGSAVGKRNGSSLASNLSYATAVTTARASAEAYGAKISLDLAIADVEGSYSYTVTKTTTTGWTATDTLNVPGGYYGYIQPKVEFRSFHIALWATPGNCGNDVETMFYSNPHLIVTNPFFSECTARSACTPKP